jgi:arylsulfatase A-like enzyme
MAIRQGDWKLVKAAPGRSRGERQRRNQNQEDWRRDKATVEGAELFNLKSDPGEQTNVAAENPEKVKQLAAAWQSWNAELIDPLWGPPTRGKRNARPNASPNASPNRRAAQGTREE